MTKISKIKVQGVTHEIKDNEAYVKPASGIPASDIAEGVIPDISGKQDTLVSGENIKTINNQSILGEGNLVIAGPDISGKADKVSDAVSGNFAALDSEGNLTDSGHKHSDYLTEHQDISGKQDVITDLDTIRSGAAAGATAYQKPSTGIPANALSSAVQTSLGKADTALQSYTETDPTVPSWAKASSKPSYSYSEISDKPTLGTAAAKDVADSGNASTTQVVMGNDTRLSDARPASDVYSWAKASSKPDYSWSEISSRPTAVSSFTNDMGYLTSHQSLAAYEPRYSVVAQSSASFTAAVETYYRFDSAVGSMTVTLPAPSDSYTHSIFFQFTAGSSPAVTFSSSKTINYYKDFAIEANTTYEVNALYNGSKWIVSYGIIG